LVFLTAALAVLLVLALSIAAFTLALAATPISLVLVPLTGFAVAAVLVSLILIALVATRIPILDLPLGLVTAILILLLWHRIIWVTPRKRLRDLGQFQKVTSRSRAIKMKETLVRRRFSNAARCRSSASNLPRGDAVGMVIRSRALDRRVDSNLRAGRSSPHADRLTGGHSEKQLG
jgi:hypothetical protein